MNYLEIAINQIIKEQGISNEWNSLIKDELNNLDIKDDLNRKDLTHIPFVTIDGEDAKDFDDAVFCSANKSSYILKVAIADVASVVLPNTELDKEAFRRGTSIYFPRTVIPMLPEIISNNICSLVPNEIRNVLICEIIFNLNGEINSYKFFEAQIRSFKRFTYNEIENQKIKESNILDSIESLKKLTNILLQNKAKRNALEIESTEPYINIDDTGIILDMGIPERLFAHQMIEESMIAANICAAKFLKKHYGFGVYRVHEEPESLKIENLKNFFSLKGHSNKKNENILNLINSLIRHANKDDTNKLLNILILQSLKRAQYSSKQIGHFGLQLKEYSHFTSPIRRYPDLLVHRMIKNILNNSNSDFKQENLEDNLGELTSLEKRAEISSRQVNQQLICYQLKKFIGDEFDSFVVGVTEFGLFCEIDNYYISGLLHVSDLRRDRYIFDAQANILKGRNTGKTYRIGQKIKVQLANVVPEERKIILIPKN
jgi:ribonuclease R